MNWEAAVNQLRSDSSNDGLILDAYLSADLYSNVERFRASTEFESTIAILEQCQKIQPSSHVRLLDVGAGNGIASLAFALHGFEVTAIEPDPSTSVGSSAIRILRDKYKVPNLDIYEAYMEDLAHEPGSFDIVYGRQVMHHAYDLKRFAKNCYSMLKPGGLLLTVRDHVIKNDEEKRQFLANHPLHRLYGGENAFLLVEYREALETTGFTIAEEWGPTDSPLNLSPWNSERIKQYITEKAGSWAVNSVTSTAARWLLYRHLINTPGRLYSLLCIK